MGSQFSGEGVNDEWEIGDTLAQWWRPNFETFMYPFIPAHVTRPKECKKLYFIQLPRTSTAPPYADHRHDYKMLTEVSQRCSRFPRT